MDADTSQAFAEMRRENAKIRQELETLRNQFRNLRVADESGGGRVILSGDESILKINGLAAASSYAP